ncbi:MAG TPA: hypothetical protein VFH78_16360, partial [Candidatus Thermoplasmatota archaeon]|nr:hypothetical protein [Candidatus Thermoplasmatota archaeon]
MSAGTWARGSEYEAADLLTTPDVASTAVRCFSLKASAGTSRSVADSGKAGTGTDLEVPADALS